MLIVQLRETTDVGRDKKLTEETRESLVALPWGYPSRYPVCFTSRTAVDTGLFLHAAQYAAPGFPAAHPCFDTRQSIISDFGL